MLSVDCVIGSHILPLMTHIIVRNLLQINKLTSGLLAFQCWTTSRFIGQVLHMAALRTHWYCLGCVVWSRRVYIRVW